MARAPNLIAIKLVVVEIENHEHSAERALHWKGCVYERSIDRLHDGKFSR